MEISVKMSGIKKSFGANYVLKEVDFAVEKGSIHALLGENGAGKSTLMNILGNVVHKDGGTIQICGQEVDPAKNPRVIDEKIAFNHQELSLINALNIFENLYMGKELKKGFLLDKKTMCARAREVLGRMGVDIDPTTMVTDLNPSYKQITEIARALLKDAQIIIMDEPTTSLTEVETELIFEVMRNLRSQGISLIFISHKLNEVLAVCDAYTILRDGEVVAVGKVENSLTEKDLSTHMVGEEVKTEGIYSPRELGDVILEIQNLTREREYKNINLNLRKGEILGVTGLLGDGRTELFASVYGANPPYEGKVIIEGKEVKMTGTAVAMKNKIAYLPKNRKENGIIADLNIKENLALSIMGRISEWGILRNKTLEELTAKYVEKLDIRIESADNPITSLSGGNQQKVVLAKALCTDPSVVILDNPTQGVDVGAKMEIYRQIVALAQQGYSFIILSNEVPELQRTCDRVYVMFQGEIRQEFSRDEMTEENIMLISTGGKI
jgi:ribose transport system ATP-binding protein